MTTRQPVDLARCSLSGTPAEPAHRAVLDLWQRAIEQAKAGDPAKLLWALFEEVPDGTRFAWPIPDEVRVELVEALCNRTWSLASLGSGKLSDADRGLIRRFGQALLDAGVKPETVRGNIADELNVSESTVGRALRATSPAARRKRKPR